MREKCCNGEGVANNCKTFFYRKDNLVVKSFLGATATSAVTTSAAAITTTKLGFNIGMVCTSSFTAALSGFCLGGLICCAICKCATCCCKTGEVPETTSLLDGSEIISPTPMSMQK